MDKVIKNFNLDFSDIPAAGENRQFTIVGDSGAVFNLEVKKSNGYYYNFIICVIFIFDTTIY